MRPLIYVADVGQGNCNIAIFGTSPSGDGGKRSVVVDCGPKTAEDVPVELLRDRDVTWIDALILTHNDRDHIGGLTNILNEYRGEIGRIFYTGDRNPQQNVAFAAIDEYYREGSLATQPIHISIPELDDGIVIYRSTPDQGPLIEIVIIAPTGYEADRAAARNRANDASAITVVRYENSKIVFPGDASIESWKALQGRRKDAVKANAIVVPHHGGLIHDSNKPEELEWLYRDAIRCEYALISAGSNNRQGRGNEDSHHPRIDVLTALYDAGLKVVCTELTPNCAGCKINDLKPYRAKQNPAHASQATRDNAKIACAGTIAIDMHANEIRFLDHPQIHDSDWVSNQRARCPLRM